MKAIVFKRLIFISVISFAFSSCINLKNVRLMQGEDELEGTEYPNPRASSYRVNTGDNLFIKVVSTDPATSKFFQTDLPALMNNTYLAMNSYRVDEDGNLTFSFIEKMQVKGKTVAEIQKQIQESLNQYFKDAHVSVKLANFRVSVLGEVKSAGTFTIDKEEITILQALAQAGGSTDVGNVQQVKLVRKTTNGNMIHVLDLTSPEILRSPYYYLQPDDIIYVEARNAKVYALEKMPYAWLFSFLSIGIAVYALMK